MSASHQHSSDNQGTHLEGSSSSGRSNGSPNDPEKQEELETIHTNERVGSHTNYYEKGGLRTQGDGEDHVGAHHRVSASSGPVHNRNWPKRFRI